MFIPDKTTTHIIIPDKTTAFMFIPDNNVRSREGVFHILNVLFKNRYFAHSGSKIDNLDALYLFKKGYLFPNLHPPLFCFDN
jgi:hypothetical protein